MAGRDLLDRLRTTGRPRPAVDPELGDRLATLIEDGLATAGAGRELPTAALQPAGGRHDRRGARPVVVTKDRLTRVLACEAHHSAEEFGDRRPTVAMACGVLVDALFRQLVTTGSIADPVGDAMAALALDERQADLLGWIDRLPPAERSGLAAEVERQAHGLVDRWPALDPTWLPRTQQSLRVALAGGSVELSARVDLAIGRPAHDTASIGIVEVKSGQRRPEHRADLHFYALIEALRSAAPPFVVATYYTRTGELDVEPVGEDLLVASARRVVSGAAALLRLEGGDEPARTPNALCARCVALPHCPPGARHVDRRAGR